MGFSTRSPLSEVRPGGEVEARLEVQTSADSSLSWCSERSCLSLPYFNRIYRCVCIVYSLGPFP